MDNKKWYKRFSTIFWWSLTILPFIVLLVILVGSVANLSLSYETLSSTDLKDYFEDIFNNNTIYSTAFTYFSGFSIPALTTAFGNMFNLFGMDNYLLFGIVFGFMLSIQVYHLVFDVLVWLPHKAHELMERC